MALLKTYQTELKRLESLEAKARGGGGQVAVNRHHQKGKLTARERLSLLFDPESFFELNKLAETRNRDFEMDKKKIPGDGVITGYGEISGRLVFAYAQDSTYLGGSVSETHALKICRIMDKALTARVPLIALCDSVGGRLQEGFAASRGVAGMFYRNTAASGIIPQIAAIMGPSAGLAAYSPALMDFIIMTQTSQMVITGPAIIKAVTGESATMEELGGARVHSEVTGQGHFVVDTDESAIQRIKELLGYLPSNKDENPPVVETGDALNRMDDSLEEIVPSEFRKAYDMHQVLLRIVDNRDFLEVLPKYAANIIIGFARLGGNTVGIIANQPLIKAGCLDVDSSDKAARFIRFCDAFNIPLINLVDVPGYFPGMKQEHSGIIRHGAKMLYAYSEATVPKITLTLRKNYGGANMGMCCMGMGVDIVMAWPIAKLAIMDSSAAIDLIYAKDISAAKSPEAFRDKKVKVYDYKYSNPFFAASAMLIDSIIRPRETRFQLINALKMLRNKQRPQPNKRHGNIPL